MVKSFVKYNVEFEKDWTTLVKMLLMIIMVGLDELVLLEEQVLVAGCEIVTRVVAAMVEKLGAVMLEIAMLVVALVVVAACVVVVGTVEIGIVLTKENMVFVYTVDNIVVRVVENVLDIGTRKERIDVGVEVVVCVVDVVDVGDVVDGVVVERKLGLDTRKVVQTVFVVRLFVV